jgi:uncharacterized membrane protein YciS (DUF1049 family)
MALVWLILGAILAIAAFAFGIANTQMVNLNFYSFYYPVPLWAVMVVSLAVGLFIGLLLTTPGYLRTTMRRRRLARDLTDRERQIGQLQQRVADLEGASRPSPALTPTAGRTLPDVPDVSPQAGVSGA